MADVSARPLTKIVLTINCGSSSVKVGLFATGQDRVAQKLAASYPLATIDRGGVEPVTTGHRAGGSAVQLASTPVGVVSEIQRLIADSGTAHIDAIGHRIVHGGPNRFASCRIDVEALRDIAEATVYAPVHNSFARNVLGAAGQVFQGVPQFACFDTAFHSTMPDCAKRLPIPLSFHEAGAFRYGFHGLSCSSVVRHFGASLPKRVIVAHLGAGASVTAIRNGISQDTSMGLTPCGGLIMGTRTGDLDPGVLAFMAGAGPITSEAIADLTDRQSGLLAISGLSSDMAVIRAHADGDPRARLAISMFCNSARKHIAAMISVLNGVDSIVFTGGIGENDWETRAEICRGLGWAGVSLDGGRNRDSSASIGADASRVAIHVLCVNENEEIARDVGRLLAPPNAYIA